jgi:hypothetical protein
MIIKLIIPGFLWLSFILAGCDLTDSNANPALNLKLDKQSYSVADTLRGTFTVKNLLPYPVSFRFSSSCQYGLKIKSENTIFREIPEMCAAVLTGLSLKSGESVKYEFVLPLEYKEYKELLKGNYEIEAFLLDNNSSSIRKPFTIN